MNRKLQGNPSKRGLQYIPLEGDEIMSVSDLGCAAALITASFTLLTLDKENPLRVRFVFSREADIEKVANDYWSNRLKQKSRSYWDNIRTLKNRLYSED